MATERSAVGLGAFLALSLRDRNCKVLAGNEQSPGPGLYVLLGQAFYREAPIMRRRHAFHLLEAAIEIGNVIEA